MNLLGEATLQIVRSSRGLTDPRSRAPSAATGHLWCQAQSHLTARRLNSRKLEGTL
jgi:hypothetical protein